MTARDLDELAFRCNRDDVGVIFMLCLPAGRAGIAGRIFPRAIQGSGENGSRGPLADPLHPIEEIGVGDAVFRHGALQNRDLFSVSVYLPERHDFLCLPVNGKLRYPIASIRLTLPCLS